MDDEGDVFVVNDPCGWGHDARARGRDRGSVRAREAEPIGVESEIAGDLVRGPGGGRRLRPATHTCDTENDGEKSDSHGSR